MHVAALVSTICNTLYIFSIYTTTHMFFTSTLSFDSIPPKINENTAGNAQAFYGRFYEIPWIYRLSYIKLYESQ